MRPDLESFVAESNRIEGIHHITEEEIRAHDIFLQQSHISVDLLGFFVRAVVLDPWRSSLRSKPGMNVYVGNHRPPPGGPEIQTSLLNLIYQLPNLTPHTAHCTYETLHPFMDGNGRSGRALWLWLMQRDGQLAHALQLGFLHTWYYQSLQATRP